MQETRVRFLGWEDPLEKKKAARSSILAWEIPCTEELDRLQPMGPQRCGHDQAIEHVCTHIHTHTHTCACATGPYTILILESY